ncbi:vacuolar sorting protein 39 domain 2-domain-containing protein [Obelidium mucronatum]|nr:vacuolar sorting protein 39 domain 2-domain-containing protein [Obelidium mucronatum]
MGGKLGIAQLPKGQLMLTRNDAGVFVNSDASPLIERDLQWSGPPDYITFSAPYVVAFIAGCIEVRSLTTGGIVQRVEFQDSQTVALGGDSLIHVSSLNCIWRLLPVSFEDQIEHLIASNQFIEAQRLIEELEFSSEEEKISNIIRVRGLYAHFMFTSERKYEEAISILSELRASPIDIVNLFPQFSLLGPSSELPVTDKVALAALKDYLILQRQILSKLRKLHQRPNHLPSNQIPPTFVSATNTEATTHTTIAASSLFSGSDHGVPDPVPFPATVLANAEDAVFLSSVVDTTLLKVYLTVNEALVGSLVRVENYCDIEESEGALKSKNKHRELIEFYYGKGLHRRALENLVDHPDGIVSYLKKLDINANVDLFIEFIGPVFDRDAIEGMNIFTDRYEEIPLKTQLKIQHYLEVRSSSLEARYLEYLIEDGGSEQPEFHDRIILLYLQELVDSLAEMQEPPPKTQGLLFSENTGGGGGGGGFVEDGNSSDLGTRKTIAFLLMRRKLVSFLEKSKFYRPDRVVGLFPEDVLLEERTVILGRLNRHTESLKICIEKLENYSLAQRYCEIHYSATDPLCSDIFITLLTLMLEVQKSSFATGNEKIKMDQIIDFVVQYGTYLDGTRILPLLPPTLPLSSLVGYFEKSLQSLHFTDHNAKVGLNVATLEHIQVQEKLIEYQSRSITIMEDRQCARCSKKIAGSVFAAYAKDLVVHVYCMT